MLRLVMLESIFQIARAAEYKKKKEKNTFKTSVFTTGVVAPGFHLLAAVWIAYEGAWTRDVRLLGRVLSKCSCA